MRNLIVAATVALAATLSAGVSANAADVRVVIGHHRAPARHHVDIRKPDHRTVVRHWELRHADCFVKKTASHHHGHRAVKKTRVCR